MLKKIILKIIKIYQLFISPNIGRNCRFYPSCSDYSCLAIKKYGTAKGLWMGLKRIVKCGPWSRGGVDEP